MADLIGHADDPDHGGGVDERREERLLALLRRLHQHAQRAAGAQHGDKIVDGNGRQQDPGRPAHQGLFIYYYFLKKEEETKEEGKKRVSEEKSFP